MLTLTCHKAEELFFAGDSSCPFVPTKEANGSKNMGFDVNCICDQILIPPPFTCNDNFFEISFSSFQNVAT